MSRYSITFTTRKGVLVDRFWIFTDDISEDWEEAKEIAEENGWRAELWELPAKTLIAIFE